jgi:hypothetical protein
MGYMPHSVAGPPRTITSKKKAHSSQQINDTRSSEPVRINTNIRSCREAVTSRVIPRTHAHADERTPRRHATARCGSVFINSRWPWPNIDLLLDVSCVAVSRSQAIS